MLAIRSLSENLCNDHGMDGPEGAPAYRRLGPGPRRARAGQDPGDQSGGGTVQADAQVALSNRERGLAVCPRSSAAPLGVADPDRMAALSGSTPRPWPQRMIGECAFPVSGFGAQTWSCCLPVEVGRPYCFGHLAILRGDAWPPVECENLGA
jgi:hypothetical protein